MPDFKATNGTCPYCSSQHRTKSQEQPAHPQKTSLVCVECGRYSTEMNGRRYPHDNPNDPLSSIGVSVRLPIGE